MFSAYKPVVSMASILLITLIACNNYSDSKDKTTDAAVAETNKFKSPAASNNAQYETVDTAAAPEPAPRNEDSPKQPGTPASASNVDWDKKIIKNATLTVEAKSHKSFNDFVHEQVKRSGGYVAEEEQNKSDYKIENIVTIKVPVDQF